MKITVDTIPHNQQRYDTCGDWQFDTEGNLSIKISDTGDAKMNFLLARHELDEAMLCQFNGVTTKQVDDYDFVHPEAGGDCFSDNLDAPYSLYHNLALASEFQMSVTLGVDWKQYGDTLEKIGWQRRIESV